MTMLLLLEGLWDEDAAVGHGRQAEDGVAPSDDAPATDPAATAEAAAAVGDGRRDDNGTAPLDDATLAVDGTDGRRDDSAASDNVAAAAAVSDGRQDKDSVACSDDASPATEATNLGVGVGQWDEDCCFLLPFWAESRLKSLDHGADILHDVGYVSRFFCVL